MAEKQQAASKTAKKPKEQPAPVPVSVKADEAETTSPTRYGDWERNGRCIDF